MITIYHYHDYCCILLLLYAIVINSYYCNCSWLLSRLAINAKSWHQVQTAHISYMWFCDPKKSLVVQSSFQVYERTCGSSPHLWRIKRSIKPAGLILVILGAWFSESAVHLQTSAVSDLKKKHLILWMDIVSSQSELWKIPFGHQSWQAGKCTNESLTGTGKWCENHQTEWHNFQQIIFEYRKVIFSAELSSVKHLYWKIPSIPFYT